MQMKARLVALVAGFIWIAVACSSNGDHDEHGSTGADALKAPSDLKVIEAAGGAHLTWKDNSDNEDQFMIERKQGAGAFTTLDTVAANKTDYHDSKVTAGLTYTYRVLAMAKSGVHSQGSNEVMFTVPAAGGPAPDGGASSDGGPVADMGSDTANKDANDAAAGEMGGHDGHH
jgi:hypothetical protein